MTETCIRSYVTSQCAAVNRAGALKISSADQPPAPFRVRTMYGRSTYISPLPAGFVAAAEFYDFAPMSCVCLGCLVGEDQRKRTYAHGVRSRRRSAKDDRLQPTHLHSCAPLSPLIAAVHSL